MLILVDGRPELVEEIQGSSPALRACITKGLSDLRAEAYFDYAVEGVTASYGPVGIERAGVVRDRIEGLLTY